MKIAINNHTCYSDPENSGQRITRPPAITGQGSEFTEQNSIPDTRLPRNLAGGKIHNIPIQNKIGKNEKTKQLNTPCHSERSNSGVKNPLKVALII